MNLVGIVDKIADQIGLIDEIAVFVDKFLEIRYAQLQGLHNSAL